MNVGESISGAVFSEDRRYRCALWRIWDRAKPAILFIGLNPSVANEVHDDPTIRRVIRFAKRSGYGGLFVGNLFDQITPYPEALDVGRDQGMNDIYIYQMRGQCVATLVGWGHFGELSATRTAEILALVGKPVYCMGTTKSGEPRHPLYLHSDTPFVEYEGGPT